MHKLEESQYEIDVFEALLERSSPNVAWGVTLGGEGSPASPLHITHVCRSTRIFSAEIQKLVQGVIRSPVFNSSALDLPTDYVYNFDCTCWE